MNKKRRQVFDCPVEFTLDVLGGKWTTVLLAHLKDEPLTYGGLRRRVSTISEKMLTQRLHELEAAGLVIKLAGEHGECAGRYALSERGASFRPLLQAMFDWGLAAAEPMEVTIKDHAHQMVR